MAAQLVWIMASDGTRLCTTLHLPDGDGPWPALIEALPYRMHDLTAYGRHYDELAAAGFAVCRVDLRGTGSSDGIATDEYPDIERADLRDVIEWLAAQPWCTGRIGMFGTSYSGFNALHMAAEGVPELGAVIAFYASDDRYTDDVHHAGGVLRASDLIDYVTYMVAMNALPPVPAVWGHGWEDVWRRRVEETPAWVLDWLREQVDGPMWRRGSVRLGPGGAGYERITCPTMIVCGWADGYRNNTFRTVPHLDVPWRLLAGPWSHADPATSRPGPNIDATVEMVAFFDEHLRDGPPSSRSRAQVFVRRAVSPEADLDRAPRRVARRRCVAAAGLGRAGHRAGARCRRRRCRGARRRRRRRDGGVELVRRVAAVGATHRSAVRRRPLADLRLDVDGAGRAGRERRPSR